MLVYYLVSNHEKQLFFIRRGIDLPTHYSSYFLKCISSFDIIFLYMSTVVQIKKNDINPFFPTVPTFAVRETASLGQQMLERWEKIG